MIATIFNGPPGSGKDECASYCHSLYPNSYHRMFKEKLFELVLSIYNISSNEFFNLYNNRETKNLPTEKLRGLSPRAAMINVSENIIKPNFGDDYFGVIAAERMSNENGIYFFSDGGFESELEPVYNKCNGNVLIIRLHREGCNFKEDSRGYLSSFKKAKIVDVQNDKDLVDLYRSVQSEVCEYLKEIDNESQP